MIDPPLPAFPQLSIKLIIKGHVHPLGIFLLLLHFCLLGRQLLIRQIMGVLPSRETNNLASRVQVCQSFLSVLEHTFVLSGNEANERRNNILITIF